MEVLDPLNGRYVVPVGFIAVVRDMRFYLPNTGVWPLGSVCTVATDSLANVIWDINGINPGIGVYTWEGRQVFTSTLWWYHQATTANLAASGYLLTA